MSFTHAGYLSSVIKTDRLRLTVRNLVAMLSKYEFDTIAFRGLSGTLVAPSVALAMDKKMIAVRKDTDGCHSCQLAEGDGDVSVYVILDDIIDTGATIAEVKRAVKRQAPEARCIGVALYYNRYEGIDYSPLHKAATYVIDTDMADAEEPAPQTVTEPLPYWLPIQAAEALRKVADEQNPCIEEMLALRDNDDDELDRLTCRSKVCSL